MSDDPSAAALALALTDGIGWKLLNRLLDHFGVLDTILRATPDDLRAVRGIGPTLAGRLQAINLDSTRELMARLVSRGVNIATWDSPNYPASFTTLEDRPLVVFMRGAVLPTDRRSVAIVGTREASPQSAAFAESLASTLVEREVTIISGLALGIDGCAHRGALKAGGRTIAVLGSGVLRVYPPEHQSLAAHILEPNRGALLSEPRPDSPPSADALVFRNRLITALGAATVVIEAGATSGALHAARRARSQGRPLFALPNGDGNRALIESGLAHCLANSVDAAADQLIAHL